MQQLTPAYILNRVASSTFRKDFFDYIFSENDNASWQKELEKRLAKIINYREKKFKKLPQAEKTRLLVRRIGVHKLKGPLVDALTGFVIEQRRFLLTKFLDQCEVEHDLGVVEIGTQPPSVGIALSVLRSLSKDTVHIDELKALCAVGSISKSEEGWQDMFRECYVRLDLPEEPVQRKKSNQDAEVESEQKQSEAPTQASSATSKTESEPEEAANTDKESSEVLQQNEDGAKTDESQEARDEGGVPVVHETTNAGYETLRELGQNARMKLGIVDEVILKVIVEAVKESELSLSIADVHELVEELKSIAGSRPANYFHEGFLQQLSGEIVYDGSELNEGPLEVLTGADKAWFLTGRFEALDFGGENEAVTRLFNKNFHDGPYALPDWALKPSTSECVARIQKIVHKALWRSQDFVQAVHILVPSVLGQQDELLGLLFEHLSEVYCNMNAELAEKIVAKLKDVYGESQSVPAPESREFELLLREAQCLKSMGMKDDAIEKFEKLLEAGAGEYESDILTDIGLAKCGLKWLAELDLPAQEDEKMVVRGNFSDGFDYFSRAVDAKGRKANACCALGTYYMLNENYEEARKYLDKAERDALKRADVYEKTRVLSKLRMAAALARILSYDDKQFANSVQTLTKLHKDGHRAPKWLLEKAAEVCLDLGHEGSREMRTFLSEYYPDVLQGHLLSADQIKTEQGAEVLKQMFENSTLKPAQRAVAGRKLLDYFCGSQGSTGEAEAIFHKFDEMAGDYKDFRNELMEFLDTDNSRVLIKDNDVFELRAKLLIIDQRFDEAAETLRNLFYGWQHKNIDQAEAILEMAEALPELESHFSAERSYINSMLHSPDEDGKVYVKGEELVGRVLVIGGNEKQKKMDDQIKRKLLDKHEGVTVDFEHPGWTPNWGDLAEKVKNRMDRYDGVVINKYIPTLLGKAVRESCGRHEVVWVGDYACGVSSTVRSVEQALRIAKRD